MKVTVGNSYSQIDGFTVNQFNELKKLLSYTINPQAAYFSGGAGNPRRYLISKKGEFPTGLLSLVQKWASSAALKIELIDKRVSPEALGTRLKLSLHLTPYQAQKDAVKAAQLVKRGTIAMSTGTGKSITMAMLVNALQVKTLIVVPNLELKRQLTQTFTQLFGSLNNITIENIDSAALNKASDYGCLIIDEAHHVAAKTYRNLNRKVWGGIFYRFFFTATPFRSRDEEQLLMESISGQVIYRLQYETAVKEGMIVPMEAYYIDLPKRPVEGYTWGQVYKELVTGNSARNELIARLMDAFHDNGLSTLCLVKEIAHGEAIQYSMKNHTEFVKGENDNNRQIILEFNLKERISLIGTTGVLGEGVDTKPAEYIIIAGLGKSKNAFMQQCGRGFRRHNGKLSCKVILLRDPSHKWTLSHFKAQVKFLRSEYGVKPAQLKIN